MATINDLPQELLHLILDFLHSSQETYRDEVGHRAVLHALASASLVARRWRSLAQSLMWSSLLVTDVTHINALLASASLGRHRTKELVALRFAAVGNAIATLVDNLIGVEIMTLDGVDSQGVPYGYCTRDWLGSANLQDLKELSIDVGVDQYGGVQTQNQIPPIPFRLTSLVLGYTVDLPLACAILAASASTLSKVNVTEINDTLIPLMANYLSHSGGTLQRLVFDPDLHETVLPLAATFTSLNCLSLLFGTREELDEIDEFLRALPNPVEELEVLASGQHHFDQGTPEANELAQAQPGLIIDKIGKAAWVGLKLIDFPEARGLEQVAEWPQGAKLLELCKEKGSELEFGSFISD